MSMKNVLVAPAPSDSGVVNFVPEKHYRHEVAVGDCRLTHSHWLSSEDGVLNSLMNIELRSGDFKAFSKLTLWGIAPGDLRRISSALLSAADSLESHQRQIGGAA